jgi:hypothetical protein
MDLNLKQENDAAELRDEELQNENEVNINGNYYILF